MELLGKFRDVDNTEKSVFRFNNGIIEITNIKNKQYKDQDVYCVPTHYYCNLGCKFCHLTEEKTNLSMTKVKAEDLIQALDTFSTNYPYVLLSFMGVGEPLLNMELVVDTYARLKYKWKECSLAISTMMPHKLNIQDIRGIPLKIHFSLHSPLDKIRKEIIPSTKVTVQEAIDSLIEYRNIVTLDSDSTITDNFGRFHSSESPILLHYTIIDGINDSDEELEGLINIGINYHIPLKIIRFNPTKYFKRSLKESLWLERLEKEYYAPVKLYTPPGANIGSSCGQFTKHYYISTNDDGFEEWKNKYQVE